MSIAVDIIGAYRATKANGERGWWLAFVYDEGANAAFKREVPGVYFDKSKHAWWVPMEHEDSVLRLFPTFHAYADQMQLL